MKRILLLILLLYHVSTLHSQVNRDKVFNQLEDYKVDSVDIKMVNFSCRYEVSFHINSHQMKCYMEDFSSTQKKEYGLDSDSMEVYLLLKDYFIERNRNFYIKKRKSEEVEFEEYDMVTISIHIGENVFRDWIYLSTDTYTNNEVQVSGELFVYSEPFKTFINLWKERTALTLGGKVLERHSSSVEFWKQYK